jgi:hypothetical protein
VDAASGERETEVVAAGDDTECRDLVFYRLERFEHKQEVRVGRFNFERNVLPSESLYEDLHRIGRHKPLADTTFYQDTQNRRGIKRRIRESAIGTSFPFFSAVHGRLADWPSVNTTKKFRYLSNPNNKFKALFI